MFYVAEANRVARNAATPQKGYISQIQENGGERKCKVVYGIRPDGSPLESEWLHTDCGRTGGREQQLFEKGANVTITGHGSRRTISPDAESKQFPQPPQAKQTNGDSFYLGKKGGQDALFDSWHKPKDQGGQQGGGSGGSGGSGGGGSGGSGGGGQGGQDDEHFHESYVGKPDQTADHQEQQNGSLMGGGGGGGGNGGGGAGGGAGGLGGAQGGQSQQHDPSEAKMKRRTSSSKGLTDRYGKDNRMGITDKGAKLKAKDETFFAALTAGQASMSGKKTAHVTGPEGVYVNTKNPRVQVPWKLGSKKQADSDIKDDNA